MREIKFRAWDGERYYDPINDSIILRKANALENKRIKAYLTVSAQNHIRFSKTAEKIMGLCSESRVNFFENENAPGEWFLTVNEDGEFGIKRQWNGHGTSSWLQFQCRPLVHEIWDSLEIDHKTINLHITEQRDSLNGNVYYKLKYNPSIKLKRK